jgi:hypothetical protein
MKWGLAIGVNLLVPLLGVTIYPLLWRRMRRLRVQSPPFFPYFILFATFGGWPLVVLTAFWDWSGMGTLGVLALILAAPFVTTGIAVSLRNRRAYLFSIGALTSPALLTTGGLYIGPSRSGSYCSNIPPREVYLEELKNRGNISQYEIFKRVWGL